MNISNNIMPTNKNMRWLGPNTNWASSNQSGSGFVGQPPWPNFGQGDFGRNRHGEGRWNGSNNWKSPLENGSIPTWRNYQSY